MTILGVDEEDDVDVEAFDVSDLMREILEEDREILAELADE